MVIDSSRIGMESERSYKRASATVRRFAITDYRQGPAQENGTLNAAVNSDTHNAENSAELDKEKQTGETNTVMQDWQTRFQSAGTRVNIRSSSSQTVSDIRQLTIRYIFDLLFSSRRSRDRLWSQEETLQTGDASYEFTQQTSLRQMQGGQGLFLSDKLLTLEPRPLTASVKVLNYTQQTMEYEAEDTKFSTVGTVKTADGREINFNVNVGMSRRFEQTFTDELELASFTFCDPLVINLDTDVAELSDQTFYFDIDGDGELDEVSQLGSGSGYLALDKNGDGQINDGSELFGTASGNGFADLAKYDEDGNGWIDENDAIWHKLKIWTKDENGNAILYGLAEKGVGAICLQNVSTDFTVKGETGQTRGAIRNSGVFLYENGNVGTVQHVDVAKFDRGA